MGPEFPEVDHYVLPNYKRGKTRAEVIDTDPIWYQN